MTRLIEFKKEGPVETEVSFSCHSAYKESNEISVDIDGPPHVVRLVLTPTDAMALIASMAQALQRLYPTA